MFKKLIGHDKSKSKSSSSKNSKAQLQPQQQNNHQTNNQFSKVEKESTQHIENANGCAVGGPGSQEEDDDYYKKMMHLEEDLEDLKPITDDPSLPFGDGANKIFGMENFGNTCYCNSILQVLYYTTEFRKLILTFPERDPQNLRKRRLNVPGNKIHGFTQLHLNQLREEEELLNNSGLHHNSNHLNHSLDSKVEKKKGLFGMGKTSKSNGGINGSNGSSANDNNNDSSHFNDSSLTDSHNGGDTGASDSNGNVSNTNSNSHLIDKNIANKYPALKAIKPVYQLNQQRTLSILGDLEDPTANLERRKRHALMTGPIVNLDLLYSQTYGMESNLFSSLKDIFECMVENKSQTGVVSPQKLIEVLKEENELFRSSMHQDAHEFLNFLVNSVLEVVDMYDVEGGDGNKVNGSTRKISSTSSMDVEKKNIHDIFEGLLTSETKCLCCETISTRDEMFLDLSIDLTPSSSVTSCLKQFSLSEMLQEQNKFYCDACHSLQEALKSIRLKKLPKVLALHLKRFKYSEQLNRNMKLFHRVTYPKNLRIFNTTMDSETPDKLYQLYAVVVHIGGGPHHGHYVSLIKTENFGWLLFDDEAVESIDENYVFKFFGDGPGLATLYVLFYKETDEISNMKNNLFNGLEDDQTAEEHNDTTLDLGFNHGTGELNEINTKNDINGNSHHNGHSDGNSGDQVFSVQSHSTTAFDSTLESSLAPPSVPTPQSRTTSNGSTIVGEGEKRKSKRFGWKK